MKKVVVLGFGRSGTTWVSDIISKITGRLILFEPFHPSVTDSSRTISYSSVTDQEQSGILKHYCENVLNKQHKKMWLMRNHVPWPLEKVSEGFLARLWEECQVLGFKEIRANFMIRWLKDDLNAEIVYIMRHPCAVVASIRKRSNFWEFGWPETYNLFLERTLYDTRYKTHAIHSCESLVENAQSDVEKYAIMWAITHAICMPELDDLGVPIFFYEDFYNDPFRSVRGLCDYLRYDPDHIHPSYIFTPSMTSLKTLHGLCDIEQDLTRKGASFFWEGILSGQEVDRIVEIAHAFGIVNYDKKG